MKYNIYTDGACSGNPGPGGWGFVFVKPNSLDKKNGGELDTTNNRMELTAVIKAMEAMYEHIWETISENEYVIYSDSAYVINAINLGWLQKWERNGFLGAKKEPIKNRDLWETLYQLIDDIKLYDCTVKFEKVKGHAGNLYNEMVDGLAVDARKKVELQQ